MKLQKKLLKSLATIFVLIFCIQLQAQDIKFHITNGNVNVSGNTKIVLQNAKWINDGNFSADSSTVKLVGDVLDSLSVIGGTVPTTFFNLEIDKTSNGVLLGNEVTIANNLTLTNGILDISNYDLILDSVASISGGSSSSYIKTSDLGVVTQTVDNNDVIFPIGNETYTPVTINNAGTIDEFNVRVDTSVYDAGTSGTTISENVVGRTWHIDEATTGGSDATLTLQWNATEETSNFDRTQSFITNHNGLKWKEGTIQAANGSDPYTLSENNVTEFSTFAIGDTNSSIVETPCEAAWVSLNNVTLEGTLLRKVSGGTAWNGVANSAVTLVSGMDGTMSTEILENDKFRAIGFAEPNTVLHKAGINYGFLFRNNGIVLITESNASQGNFGAYTTGDIFTIERVGTTINYYKNGELLYTSAVSSNTDLIVDLSIRNVGGTFYNVKTDFSCVECSTFSVSTVDVKDESCSGSNDGEITVTTSDDGALYEWLDDANETTETRTNLTPGTYSVVAHIGECTDTLEIIVNTGSACSNLGCPIVWLNETDASYTSSTLTKTGSSNQYDASANSSATLTSGENGWVSMEALETNTFRAFGLATANVTSTNTDITYGFTLRDNGVALVSENGITVDNAGSYYAGDVFTIERAGTTVYYLKNDTTVYISTITSLTDLIADASIKTAGGTIYKVRTNFSCTTPCLVAWTGDVDITTANDTLTKSSSSTQYDAAANSTISLNAGENGWMSTEVIETNTFRAFGLATTNATTNNTDITYGFTLRNNGIALVSENGISVSTVGAYTTGDVFRVERFGTTIEYYQNETLVYTSLIASATDLIADFSIKTAGGTIYNALADFSCNLPERGNSDIIEDVVPVVNVQALSNLAVYPNPFRNQVTIDYTEEIENITTIELYNINGQFIRSIAVSSDGQTTIDTEDLKNGIYMITINGIKNLKVVKF